MDSQKSSMWGMILLRLLGLAATATAQAASAGGTCVLVESATDIMKAMDLSNGNANVCLPPATRRCAVIRCIVCVVDGSSTPSARHANCKDPFASL